MLTIGDTVRIKLRSEWTEEYPKHQDVTWQLSPPNWGQKGEVYNIDEFGISVISPDTSFPVLKGVFQESMLEKVES